MRGDKIINITNSKTINGQLVKWNIKRDGKFYFVKTGTESYGTFSPIEPVAEYIAFEIGRELGINVIETKLEGVKYINKEVLVSITESFLNDSEMYRSVSQFLTEDEKNCDELDDIIFNRFGKYKKEMYDMIVFDFLINNIDRHLNNFGFICDELGNIKEFAPIFDNGLSLFSDLNGSELTRNFILLDRASQSKPFRSKHYKQIKLVPKEYIKYIDNLAGVYNIIDSIDFISGNRKELIKKLIQTRNDYLKGLSV